MFLDFGMSKDILHKTAKAQATTSERDKWNYIELKSFCMENNRMKKQSIEQEEVCTNYSSDKRLKSRPMKGTQTTQ
jgi:hypothetical protein